MKEEVKSNPTDMILAEIKSAAISPQESISAYVAKWSGVGIKDTSDKAGYRMARDYRAEANRILKSIDRKRIDMKRDNAKMIEDAAMELVNLINPSVIKLDEMIGGHEQQVRDEKNREEKALEFLIENRFMMMNAVGGSISFQDAKTLSEDQFNTVLSKAQDAYRTRQEELARLQTIQQQVDALIETKPKAPDPDTVKAMPAADANGALAVAVNQVASITDQEKKLLSDYAERLSKAEGPKGLTNPIAIELWKRAKVQLNQAATILKSFPVS